MKYILSLIILAVALVSAGCSDNDNSRGPGDTKAVFNPLAPDEDMEAATVSALTGWEKLSSTHTGRLDRRGDSFHVKSLGVQFSDKPAIYYVADVNKRAERNGFIYRRGGGSYRNRDTWTSHGGLFVSRPRDSKATKFRILKVRR
jgi:hypothetical protein